MQFFLMRHGAAETSAPGGSDSLRRLTSHGIAEVRSAVEQAVGGGLAPDLILTSPYVRARETAEVASQVLGGTRQIDESVTLQPGGSPAALWDEIRIHMEANCILAITHEPLISRATSFLIGTARMAVEFQTATIAQIEVQAFGASPLGSLVRIFRAADVQNAH